MTNAQREKLCKEAADDARQEVLKLCKKVGLTTEKTLKGIVNALSADESKVFYDKDRNKCVVGPAQVCWSARLKAQDQAIGVLGIKAPEKLELTSGLGDLWDRVQDARKRRRKN